MRSKVVSVVIGVTVALGLFLATKNVIARVAVEGGVKAMTGLPLKLDRIDVGVFKSAIGMRGMRLHNPAGFADRVMMDVPEIYVHYDLGAFLSKNVHLREVRLHLKEFVVVKGADGRLNLDALKAVQASKPDAKAAPAPSIQIDRLRLKIGKVVYKDYTGKGEPSVQEFAINIDEEYQNITNPYVFGGLIVSRALMSTTVAKLTGFDIGPLQSMVGQELSGAISGATGAAKQATERLGGAAKELTGTAETTVKGAADSLKKLLGP